MIRYKRKIVAFIDVLGFSNLVFNFSITQLDSYFGFLQQKLKGVSKYKGINTFYISDSIILITDDNLRGCIKLFELIHIIQSSLLEINILVRGAITIGDIYLNKKDNIIVGPALINAYLLEKEAKFPRILIDRQIIKHYNFKSTVEFLTYFNISSLLEHTEIAKEDSDNCIYINYLSHLFSRIQNYSSNKSNIKNLLTLIQSSYFKNLHLDKYSWLKVKCIEEINIHIQFLNSSEFSSPRSNEMKRKKLKQLPLLLKGFSEI